MLNAQEYPNLLAPPPPLPPDPRRPHRTAHSTTPHPPVCPCEAAPATSYDTDSFDAPADTRAAARDSLQHWLDLRAGDPLTEAHRWALLPPGKLLRPVLLLEAAAAVGGSLHRVAPVAAGFELLHVGSLVHDDIIDRDEIRRGRAATHVRFGADRAIIAADALFFGIFRTLEECRRRGATDRAVADATAIIAQAGLDITRGATLELDLSGRPHGDIDGYLELARLKTAALLRAACRTGAVLVGAPAEQAEALGEFGEALGLAFQIQDDLLPYEHPEQGTESGGKPRTSDLRNGRPALPLLLAYRDGGEPAREELRALFADEGEETVRQERLHRLLTETGALKSAREFADGALDRCRRALAVLPDSPHRDRLTALVDRYSAREETR